MAEGRDAYQKLLDSGFSSQEAEAWKAEQTSKLLGGGFTPNDVDAYWGDGEPNTNELQGLTEQDMGRLAGTTPAANLVQDVMAGWQSSAIGLTMGRPKVSPRDAGIASAIATGVGQMVGDLPLEVAGVAGGAAAGAPAGPLGILAAAGAGGFALPQAYRGVMMDHYEKGDITSFSDFWSRYTPIVAETGKAALTGAIAAPVGGIVGGKVLAKTGSRLLSSTADATAMTATATEVGGGLDGHQPDAEDFAAGAMSVLGFNIAAKAVGATRRLVLNPGARQVQENMQRVYEQTGVPPWEQAQRAASDPQFKRDVMAHDVNDEAVTKNFDQIKPQEADPYWASRARGAKEEGKADAAKIIAEDLKDMMSKKDQLDLVAELEGSADFAKRRGIPEELVTSPAGAIGKYQVTPDTAAQYGFDPARLKEPLYNENVASYILDQLNKRYSHVTDPAKRLEAVLIAYNAGPGRADRWLVHGNDSKLPVETQKYLGRAQKMGAFGKRTTPPGGEGGGGGKGPPANLPGDTPDAEGNFPKLTPEMTEQVALDLVDKPNPKSFLDRGRDLAGTAYDQIVSELGPAKRFDKELDLKEGDTGIEDMFRSTYASAERAGVMMRHGGFDPLTFEKTSDVSLMGAYDLAKKAGGTQEGFVAYRLAKRFLEKSEQGIDTGLFAEYTKDPNRRAEMARELVKAGDAKYKEASAHAREANDAKLDYARDSGLYSAAQTNAFKQLNKEWLPHKRVLEDVGAPINVRTRSKQPRKTLKQMEGSQRHIVEPVAAEVESFHTLVAMADRNRAVGAIVGSQEQAKALGLKLIEKLPRVEVLDKDGKVIPDHVSPDDAVLAYHKAEGKLGPEDFIYYRNGEPEIWRATGREDLAKMIRGATPIEADIVTRGMRWFANLQRSGITTLPDYIAKMALRDQFYTPIVDKFGGLPFQNLVIGAMHVIKQDAMYLDFVRSGGMGAALADMDTKYIQRDIEKVFAETGTWNAVANSVRHPLDAGRLLMERVDAMSRLGYFSRQTKAGVEPLKGAMRARKAYLDFQEKGTSALVNWWTGVTPFARPFILGKDQLARGIKEDPMGLFIRGIAFIGIGSAGLFALNYLQDETKDKDDPTRYDNMDRWVRDNFFVFPEIGGIRPKIPRSQGELGLVFGAITDRALDYAKTKDPRAFKDWATNFIRQFTPQVVPALPAPIIEQFANRSMFTGRPLIPASLEEASGYMAYTEWTTDPAKQLARILSPQAGLGIMDVSPIVLENYARAWAGTLGMDALRVLNATMVTSNRPWSAADIPFVGSFIIRNPTMQAAPIQDFFDEAAKVRSANRNFNLAIKRADEGEITETSSDTRSFVQLDTFTKAITQQYATVQAIAKDPNMTADEKRQLIESTYVGMIALSRGGLQMIDAVKANGS